MKKQFLKSNFFRFSASLLLLIILVGGIYSCQRDTPECTTCKPIVPAYVATLQIANQQHKLSFWEGKAATEGYIYASSDNGVTSSAQIVNILEYFNVPTQSLQSKDSILAVIIYGTEKPTESLAKDKVAGFLLYYVKNGVINTMVFRKNGTNYEELAHLSAETPRIMMGEIRAISYIVHIKGEQTVAMMIPNKSISPERKKVYDAFKHKINTELQYWRVMGVEAKPIYERHHMGGSDVCEEPCPATPKSSCGYTANYYPKCVPIVEDEGNCPETIAQTVASVDNSASDSKLYIFRDNVLANSAFGQHLINDFYYCGTILKGRLSYAMAFQAITMVNNKIIPIIDKLNAPGAATDNTVLYDQTTADDINAFINDMKMEASDSLYLEMLSEVSANVNYFKGMTVAQVYNEILSN